MLQRSIPHLVQGAVVFLFGWFLLSSVFSSEKGGAISLGPDVEASSIRLSRYELKGRAFTLLAGVLVNHRKKPLEGELQATLDSRGEGPRVGVLPLGFDFKPSDLLQIEVGELDLNLALAKRVKTASLGWVEPQAPWRFVFVFPESSSRASSWKLSYIPSQSGPADSDG